ncbi:MAG: MDR family MFS transporter [Pseudomonadota bacterium]|jgi:EmrB/QacA subfamily drug resistance transporter|uniref:MDR family MFS transporter n=1 Tax=Burkholderiaceae TaxID=119060 RepID=UPI0010F475D5|nr:MDR family MFS transporter [Burkholderia sp. 4M9327F10]
MLSQVQQPINNSVRPLSLVCLMLVVFIATLDQTIVATTLIPIGRALGDADAAPWIATAYLLTSAVTTLILGKLGDIVGRKPVLLASTAIFVAASALCASAPRMIWLIIFRALQGIGGGGLSPLVMAIMGDLVPARERARYHAMLGVIPAVAIILGPVLGGLIVDHLVWQWIFLLNVPIGLVAIAAIATQIKLPRGRQRRRLDVAGSVLAVIYTTAFLLVAVEGGTTYSWDSWQVAALALLGVIALLAYLRVERKAPEPITPLELFKNSIFTISAGLFFTSTAALFVCMLFVPMMLQMIFGLSASAAGGSIVPLLFGLIVATMVTGSRVAHTGRYQSFPIVGALLSGAGFYALSRINLGTPLWYLLLLLTVIGFGIGCFIQVVILAGQNAVDQRHLGSATGALNFFKTMGGAFGAAIFGALLTNRLSAGHDLPLMLDAFASTYRYAAVLMALTLALACMLREKPLSAEMLEVAEGKVDVPEY